MLVALNSYSTTLVTTDWVTDHLYDPSTVIIEIDTDIQSGYQQGHILGAIGWDLHSDLEDKIRRDIPRISQFESLLGNSGIDNDTTVLLYGDGNNRSATWAFWVLKYYRHKNVKLIDGGRRAWISEKRPFQTDILTRPKKVYKASLPDKSVRATKEYLLKNLGRPRNTVLDTRTYEEYKGTSVDGAAQSSTYRDGRIPNAIHIPWDEGATENGTFKSKEELQALYSSKGIYPTNEIIPYCRLGIRASYSWFVLKYILGYSRVKNYDGSWTEWGNSVGVPIEKG